MIDLKEALIDLLWKYEGNAGGKLPCIVGLHDPKNDLFIRTGKEFLYGDHAYFDRGWDRGTFRLIRNGHHQNRVFPRSDDRLKRWDVQIEPWRKGGRSIVIIPPSDYYSRIYGAGRWTQVTLETLQRFTDRPIHVKKTKGRLRECLLDEQDAFAVVCFMSVAGMEAALMGVPVFSTPRCCSWPINAGTLDRIESPERPDRRDWACSLAYASWHYDELGQIDFRDYWYSTKEEICA